MHFAHIPTSFVYCIITDFAVAACIRIFFRAVSQKLCVLFDDKIPPALPMHKTQCRKNTARRKKRAEDRSLRRAVRLLIHCRNKFVCVLCDHELFVCGDNKHSELCVGSRYVELLSAEFVLLFINLASEKCKLVRNPRTVMGIVLPDTARQMRPRLLRPLQRHIRR